MEVPTWWLVISAIFFAAGIVLYGVLAYAVLILAKQMRELQPQVKSIMHRVDEVSSKVDSISTNVKETVSSIGNRANSLVGSVESFAERTTSNLGKMAPFFALAFGAFRLYREFTATRGSKRS